ncbi:MAG: DNA translocase FtsK [Cyclobacteriaceae bacterium]|nr:DNA translocase FtsK 4TM domain-containing protein [Cyclobacteriaceae bacterium]MCH8515248.1 DNA translocase FtsK [Cyclobacteriaceae bacterium]
MAAYTSNTFKNKPKEKKKGGTSFSLKGKLSFFTDRRFQLSFGFFIIFFSLFLFVAMISYMVTGFADQSVVESYLDTGVREAGREVSNWLGLSGALLAHYLIFRWFGVASLLIVPFLFILGVRLSFQLRILPATKTLKFVIFFLFWISLFFGYFVFNYDGAGELSFLSGGIGYEYALLLSGLLGWGTLLLLLFAFIAFIIFFFNITHLGAVSLDFKSGRDVEDSDLASSEQSPEEELAFKKRREAEEKEAQAKAEEEKALQGGDELEFELGDQKKKSQPETKPELTLDIEGPLTPSSHEKEEKSQSEDLVKKLDLEVEEGEEEVNTDQLENYDPTLDLSSFQYPTVDLLDEYDVNQIHVTKEELESNKDKIVTTLENFKIGISNIKATIGPTVTLYEIVPEAGIKISKIKNLEDDIALSLSALGIRIIAPIPGRGTIGIEVPNKNREMVPMRAVITTEKFMKSDKDLPIILGKTISNEVFVADLAKMPHLLMAGATGQGKSVGLNVLLTSLVYKKHPSQLKFVLVDPKKVELTLFNKIERHYLAKLPDAEEAIITDTTKVIHTLNSLCREMDNRYELLKDAGCRNLKEYNQKFIKRRLNPLEGHRFLPFIVLVIDELADLMMTAGKEVETPIARLAQLARAVGIHLVVATQRPSVNVITGIIKANFPARLSFRVTSKIDSRTILDTGGAEQLVGMGDMLLSQGSEIIRLQCPFVDTPEVERVCDFIGSQRGYETAYVLPEYEGDDSSEPGAVDLSDRDSMFDEAARLIVTHQQGSTSLIQRKLKLGYNRAGRIVDQLEAAGIVGSFEGSKAREVLIQDMESLERLLDSLNK